MTYHVDAASLHNDLLPLDHGVDGDAGGDERQGHRRRQPLPIGIVRMTMVLPV